ncbi:hypothetical protein LGH70_22635 [Hymenobacter sp. BT635]|uniref:HNH nuclease domain-containing protein n=1 Tax=Hymenobacter nitidus TaxID=2880929 RepID=A0ABS8AKC7_9BACT|nr:HNH endonuclease domain-containing protein [Hymenobacter nitidus]MCB2380407.1 hypothetical protein [Hymenobacter nitidus]
MPIQHAGPENVFALPTVFAQLPDSVLSLPGTRPQDTCLVISAALWESFHRLSLYVEALCLHEWSLFTESVTQDPGVAATRGAIYALLTARPDNRRPLSWERNQIDLLLLENVSFTCPWTQKQLTQPQHYDLDHLLPLAVYPINELWNLLPVDRAFNQQVKRDRLPSPQRLLAAQPLVQAAYTNYSHSASL